MSPQTQSHARAGGAMRRALTLACTGWANRGGALASATRGVGNPRMPGANAPTPGRVAAAIRRLLQRGERHPDRRCKWRNASCTTSNRANVGHLAKLWRTVPPDELRFPPWNTRFCNKVRRRLSLRERSGGGVVAEWFDDSVVGVLARLGRGCVTCA